MNFSEISQTLGVLMQGVQFLLELKDRKENVNLIITVEKYFPDSNDNPQALLIQLLVHNHGNQSVAVEQIILEMNGVEIGTNLISEVKTDILGLLSVVGFQQMFHFKINKIDTIQPLRLPITLQPRHSTRGLALFTFPEGIDTIKSAKLRVSLNGNQVKLSKTII